MCERSSSRVVVLVNQITKAVVEVCVCVCVSPSELNLPCAEVAVTVVSAPGACTQRSHCRSVNKELCPCPLIRGQNSAAMSLFTIRASLPFSLPCHCGEKLGNAGFLKD